MGLTRVKITVINPFDPRLSGDVEVIVNTGSILPWIPRKVLEDIGMRPERTKEFRTIEGKMIRRETCTVRIRYAQSEAGVEAVFAEEGDVPVLGAVALESLGYRVNPITGELEYVGLLAV